MKKLLIIFFILMFTEPVLADIVNPNWTPEQRAEIRARKLEMYNRRYRMSVMNKACSNIIHFGFADEEETLTAENIDKCKAYIKNDYDNTIKFLEQYVKERKDYVENLKNASKQ